MSLLLCYSCTETFPYFSETSHPLNLFLTPHYRLCSWFPLSPGSLGRELVILHLVLQRNQGSDGIKQRKAFGLIYHQLQVADQDRNVHGSIKAEQSDLNRTWLSTCKHEGYIKSTNSLWIKITFLRLHWFNILSWYWIYVIQSLFNTFHKVKRSWTYHKAIVHWIRLGLSEKCLSYVPPNRIAKIMIVAKQVYKIK